MSENPFDSIKISFSSEEMVNYENQKAKDLAALPEFPGGLVRLRLEKNGRGGKSVTVFYGFEKNQQGKIGELLTRLKKNLAVGGKLTDDGFELQGDQRRKASDWLMLKGYKIKGSIE